MDFTLEPDVDGALDAVRTSLAQAGVSVASRVPTSGSAWWRSGVEDALDRGQLAVASPRYEAARSPRRTRGATRA